NGVEILVDGGAENSSAILFVVGRKVGAAAPEANPNWTAYDEHVRSHLPALTSPAPIPIHKPEDRVWGKTLSGPASRSSAAAGKCPAADTGPSRIADRSGSFVPQNWTRAARAPGRGRSCRVSPATGAAAIRCTARGALEGPAADRPGSSVHGGRSTTAAVP